VVRHIALILIAPSSCPAGYLVIANRRGSERKGARRRKQTPGSRKGTDDVYLSAKNIALFGAALLWASIALADVVAVPASLQAKLAGKLALFDRAFAARAGDRAHVLIVTRAGDPASVRFADELAAALKQIDTVGGLPHEEATTAYAGAESLAAAVKAQRPAIVYLSAGLANEAHAIAAALTGVDVLTITAEPEAVAKGIVASFDLISNQPKIVVNLKQAESQKVQFTGTLLKLALITGG
jgi:hypothetical protein